MYYVTKTSCVPKGVALYRVGRKGGHGPMALLGTPLGVAVRVLVNPKWLKCGVFPPVIELHRLLRRFSLVSISLNLSRHKFSKKAQFDVLIFARYPVTNHAKNQNSEKTSLQKSTLGELKKKLFGKTKGTVLFSTTKRIENTAETLEK